MGREIIYLSLYCHHQNDSCIKMGSDESHFNVSVGSDGQSHRTVSTNHNLSEEKGEPKRYRTEVLLLTNLTPLPLGQTGSRILATLVLCPKYPPPPPPPAAFPRPHPCLIIDRKTRKSRPPCSQRSINRS